MSLAQWSTFEGGHCNAYGTYTQEMGRFGRNQAIRCPFTDLI